MDSDPKERKMLPFLKDPSIKVGLWAIIKDNIGKDMTKIAVPVFFNDPTSLLQKALQSLEFSRILDHSESLQDQAKRLAYVTIFGSSMYTCVERSCAKPFNPLLGETYEFENDDMFYFSEQVSHHPPISANYCKSKKANWNLYNCQKSNSKFTGKTMEFYQQFRTYVEYPDLNEKYEIQLPPMSVHNLIIGTTYIDLGGRSDVKLLGNN
jgi:hypothetical protein